MYSIRHDNIVETNQTPRTKQDIKRYVTSPGKTPLDVSRLSVLSPHRARTLPFLRSNLPNTSDFPPSAEAFVRTIRYEDMLQEAPIINTDQVYPNSNALNVARERRRAVRSEFRSDPELPHIPEDFDADQLPVSPHYGSITPKKSSPSFATKRHSVSGSFNSLKRAGTKLVRRGIQGVLPVTPSRKSDLTPYQTPDTVEHASIDRDPDIATFGSELRLSQPPNGSSPPRTDIADDVFRPQRYVFNGTNDSDETVRMFYDAKESLPLDRESISVVAKTALTTDRANILTIPRSHLLLGHNLVNERTREPNNTIQAQPLGQETTTVRNIMEKIDRRQSATSLSGKEGFGKHTNPRVSRPNYTTREPSRDVYTSRILYHTTISTGQDDPGAIKTTKGISNGSEQKSLVISRSIEPVAAKSTRETSNTLHDMVKEHLRIDSEEIRYPILDPIEIVRVSTKGVDFRNAHKNYFPCGQAN